MCEDCHGVLDQFWTQCSTCQRKLCSPCQGKHLPQRGRPWCERRAARLQARRAAHWRKTGVSEGTIRWMRDNSML